MILAQERGGGDAVRQAFALTGGEYAALDAAGGHRGVMQAGQAGERGVEAIGLIGRGEPFAQGGGGLGELAGERLATGRFQGH